MPNYRRDYSGTVWFFTVVTHRRRPLFRDYRARATLRSAIFECRERYPFDVPAWVLLPDHLHCIWALPDHDRNYSRRWSVIKRRFTQLAGAETRLRAPFWQKRFWAHRIDTDESYRAHTDYIHFNPVKHGLVERVCDWRWSSFHRVVENGLYPADWGGGIEFPITIGRE